MKQMLFSLAVVLMLCSSVGLAAQPAAVPKVCDVTYTVDTNVKVGTDEFDAGTVIAVVNAMPYADVLDNSDRMLKVVKLMAKEDGKGGPYDIESGEVRSCDGGPPAKVAATALLTSGVTLRGSNRIARAAWQQMGAIIGRYEARADQGEQMGWDHRKGHKTKRNDLRQKLVAPVSDSVVVGKN